MILSADGKLFSVLPIKFSLESDCPEFAKPLKYRTADVFKVLSAYAQDSE